MKFKKKNYHYIYLKEDEILGKGGNMQYSWIFSDQDDTHDIKVEKSVAKVISFYMFLHGLIESSPEYKLHR